MTFAMLGVSQILKPTLTQQAASEPLRAETKPQPAVSGDTLVAPSSPRASGTAPARLDGISPAKSGGVRLIAGDKPVDPARNRPIPIAVTDARGKPVASIEAKWSSATPAIARTKGAGPGEYILQPNAITDGRTRIPVDALSVRTQLTSALTAAGRGRRGMTDAEILKEVKEVKLTASDGYVVTLEGPKLAEAVRSGSILRAPAGVEGETGGKRSDISPIFASKTNETISAASDNVWGIRDIAVTLN